MAPTISISESVFARLQKHATPFVDTPESVIEKALNALDATADPCASASSDERRFNPASPPNLAFTTPKRITLCGATFKKGETYWNPLMFACIREAAKAGLSPTQIAELMIVPHAIGVKEGGGYVHIAEAGISVQGQAANGAWRQAHHIAACLKFALSVEFVWEKNDKAAMPGVQGRFDLA